MVAKGGTKLIDNNAINLLRVRLIKRVTLITPNIPEAEILTRTKIRNKEDMIFAAHRLINLGAENVLIKGGHLKSKKVEDIFLNKSDIKSFNMPVYDPIHKATIIPRGRALGMVMRLPERDQLSVTREKMYSDIAVAMGGRIAEEMIFGHDKVTSGASSDIHNFFNFTINLFYCLFRHILLFRNLFHN